MPTMTAPNGAPSRRRQTSSGAKELAARAKDIAREAGLTSAYSSGEAAEVISRFRVERAPGGVLLISKGRSRVEPYRVRASVLRKYVNGASRDDAAVSEVAALMRELGHGLKTMLYGRKLGAFLLALAVQSRSSRS